MKSHQHRFRVIYGDTDMMGVVYYANYFRFFEAGRNELLRAMGIEYKTLEAQGILLPVAEASAKYLRPAKYDDELVLTLTVERVRHGSVHIGYKLVRPSDGTLLVTGETLHACVGREGKVVRIPDFLRAALSA